MSDGGGRTDLGAILESSEIKYVPPEDPHDAKLRRHKDIVGFYVTLLAIAAIVVLCIYLILFSRNTETTKWAMSVVFAIVSGTLGFRLGGRLAN